MIMEAHTHLGWPLAGITRRLQGHPADVQKLTRFRQAIDEVSRVGIQVFPIDLSLISAATAISQQDGLLTGDALIVALMRLHGLSIVASVDADFDRVPGITRYAPQ